jgi:oxaloacetate decarboxylase alpha subunit
MTLLKAIEAGIDIVDTAISPLSSGTSQPATESLALTLKGTSWDPELNIDSLSNIAEYFKPIMNKYIESGVLQTKVLMTEPKTLLYQVPGGMLSNLLSQMKALNAIDKFDKVLEEVPKVREDLGYPPLVTPMSQMVGAQAVFNVMYGERYKMIPTEIKNYVKGLYGAPAAPIKQEIIEKIIGDEAALTIRPADLLENSFETIKAEIGSLARNDEDVLSYAMFPHVAKPYFEKRYPQAANF